MYCNKLFFLFDMTIQRFENEIPTLNSFQDKTVISIQLNSSKNLLIHPVYFKFYFLPQILKVLNI